MPHLERPGADPGGDREKAKKEAEEKARREAERKQHEQELIQAKIAQRQHAQQLVSLLGEEGCKQAARDAGVAYVAGEDTIDLVIRYLQVRAKCDERAQKEAKEKAEKEQQARDIHVMVERMNHDDREVERLERLSRTA